MKKALQTAALLIAGALVGFVVGYVAQKAFAFEAVTTLPEPLVCEAGYHVESVLVSPEVPAVEEVSHIVYHEAVTEEVTSCKKIDGGPGGYIDSKCKIPAWDGIFPFKGQRWDKITEVIVVKEAWEEKVIDVEAVPGIPAVYEDQCVKDADPEPEPEPEPEPTPTPRGGGGKCLNCEKKEPVVEEEEEEPVVEEEEPAAVAPVCPALLKGYVRLGDANTMSDVFILQNFLNKHTNAGLKLTGVYDLATFAKVKAFQAQYASDVINPWHTLIPGMGTTGYVYKTTQWKINTILCPSANIAFPSVLE